MRRYWLSFLPFVLALVVAGCKVTSINYFPPHPAQLRVANLLPGVPAVDVLIGSNPTWTGVSFQSFTGYVDVENTTQIFTVNIAGTTSQLAQSTFVLAGEQPYTLVVTGTPSQPVINVLQEVANIPNNGSALISAFNGASNQTSLDLYATTPGVDLTTINPTYYGLNYNGITYNVSFSPGIYQLRATAANTKTVVYDSGPITVTGNAALFFIAYSTGSGVLVNASLLQSKSSAQLLDSTLTRVKTLHAAPQTGAVDLQQSGLPIITNVTYSGFGGYVNSPAAASQVMSFVGAGTAAPTLAAVTATLPSGADQTVFLTGFPGALQAVYLADLNLVAAPGGVRVRFVNASPNAGPLTFTVSGTATPVVTGLATPTASSYINLAAGTVTITATDTTTGDTVLTLPNVVLTSPQTSTVYVLGPVGAITGVVTQDF
ncbi:MAG: DUF4397 domain-containing protein [Betaproteobacteria bacterium]